MFQGIKSFLGVFHEHLFGKIIQYIRTKEGELCTTTVDTKGMDVETLVEDTLHVDVVELDMVPLSFLYYLFY